MPRVALRGSEQPHRDDDHGYLQIDVHLCVPLPARASARLELVGPGMKANRMLHWSDGDDLSRLPAEPRRCAGG